MIDIYLTAYGGATVWFADSMALQGSLVNTLKVLPRGRHPEKKNSFYSSISQIGVTQQQVTLNTINILLVPKTHP